MGSSYDHAVGAALPESLLIDPVASQTEADRFAALYGTEAKFWQVTIAATTDQFDNLLDDIGNTITIKSDRYGLGTGKDMVLVGVEGAFLSNEIRLTLWNNTGVTSWEYASTAAAEASGHAWSNGDQITITGGPVFLYISNASVSGYSGLVHKEPFGSGLGTLSGVTVRDSETANSDPDDWVGWTDASSGVQGTDYELDTASSLSRMRDLTITGRVIRNNDYTLASADDFVFRIVDSVTHTNTATHPSANFMCQYTLGCYDDGVNDQYIRLTAESNVLSSIWRISHTDTFTFTNTSQNRTVASRVYMYLEAGKWAVWFDDDSSPDATGTVPDPTASAGKIATIICGSPAALTGTSINLHGTDVFGKMTMA